MSTETRRNEPAPTLEEVWALFKETDLKFQETDRRFKETDLKFQETERRFKETDLKFQETDRQIKENALQSKETDLKFQETDRRFKETDLKFQETDRLIKENALQSKENERIMQENHRRLDQEIEKVNQIIGKLGNRLGEFVESMIKPSIVRIFQARGIPVHKVSQDISVDYPERGLATQIDLMAINDEVCVLIEVKSRLNIDDVNEHIERMDKFKQLFPEYADKTVYGAVAAMVLPEDIAKYAYRKGFFVIAPSGDTAVILNDLKFKPAAW